MELREYFSNPETCKNEIATMMEKLQHSIVTEQMLSQVQKTLGIMLAHVCQETRKDIITAIQYTDYLRFFYKTRWNKEKINGNDNTINL